MPIAVVIVRSPTALDKDLHPGGCLRIVGTEGARGVELSAPSRASTPEVEREAIELYRSRFAELNRDMNDRSRCDFNAARHLLDRGYESATVERAICAASPGIEERKRGHVRDYARRTVEVGASWRSRAEGLERDEEGPLEASLAPRPHTPEPTREAAALYRQHLQQLRGIVNDPSMCDFSAACRLAREGYNRETIEHAIRAESPDLDRRTDGQTDRYARDTAEAAVQARMRQLTRESDRDRGGWER